MTTGALDALIPYRPRHHAAYLDRFDYAYDGTLRLDFVCSVGCRSHLDPHEFTSTVEDPVGI